jgi:hypothetical protein
MTERQLSIAGWACVAGLVACLAAAFVLPIVWAPDGPQQCVVISR